MRKALLLSVLVATVLVPALAAQAGNPVRALKRAIFWTLVFDCAYVAAVTGFYMHD